MEPSRFTGISFNIVQAFDDMNLEGARSDRKRHRNGDKVVPDNLMDVDGDKVTPGNSMDVDGEKDTSDKKRIKIANYDSSNNDQTNIMDQALRNQALEIVMRNQVHNTDVLARLQKAFEQKYNLSNDR